MLNPSVRETIFHLKTAVTVLIFIASKLTNEVNGALREIETSHEKSETRFWRSRCVD
jgi:hypothetical protein